MESINIGTLVVKGLIFVDKSLASTKPVQIPSSSTMVIKLHEFNDKKKKKEKQKKTKNMDKMQILF